MKPVTVIGSGPSALLAVYALEHFDPEVPVRILAPGSPSMIQGAQYLHEFVNNELTPHSEAETITYVKLGTREGYARKVYGDPDAPVSWDNFPEGDVEAWPMQLVYERLWAMYAEDIEHTTVSYGNVQQLCDQSELVLCTAPAKNLCRGQHEFTSQQVFITDDEIIGVRNLLVYNGRPRDPWYRASNLFGFASEEYSAASMIGGTGWNPRRGIKPLRTNCTCHLSQPNFARLGRFGRWEKQALVHEAYKQAPVLLGNLRTEHHDRDMV